MNTATNQDDSNQPVIACVGLRKAFSEGRGSLEVLKGVDFSLPQGGRVAVVGSSGSGKSTLLHLLGGLDTPTAGEVYVNGRSIIGLSSAARGKIRGDNIGFIYQFHHLLPEFTALENVGIPLLLGKSSVKTIQAEAKRMLVRVGLGERLNHKPSQLSGGERQRVAIARALVKRPKVVMADEPTGNLDGDSADQVQSLLLTLNRELGMSLLIVTHDLALANKTGTVMRMDHGVLSSDNWV